MQLSTKRGNDQHANLTEQSRERDQISLEKTLQLIISSGRMHEISLSPSYVLRFLRIRSLWKNESHLQIWRSPTVPHVLNSLVVRELGTGKIRHMLSVVYADFWLLDIIQEGFPLSRWSGMLDHFLVEPWLGQLAWMYELVLRMQPNVVKPPYWMGLSNNFLITLTRFNGAL